MLLCFFQRKQKWRMEAIFPFIMLTFIATLYEQIGTIWFQIDSSYWFQIYTFLDLLVLAYFYWRILEFKNKHIYVLTLGALFILFYLVSLFWITSDNKFTSLMISQIPIVIMVLIFSFKWFKELFVKTEVPDLWSNGNFYFISGLLIYHSATFVLFMLSSFLIEVSQHFYDYWLVNVIATLFLRIMLSLGVWNTRTV